MQPSLANTKAALVDYLPLSTMLFSPDHRVDQLQHSKLADSLASVKHMRKVVQNNITALAGMRAPPQMQPQTSNPAPAA